MKKQAFLDFFGDFADKIHIEHIMSCWPEFELQGVEANKEKGIYGQEIRGGCVPIPILLIFN